VGLDHCPLGWPKAGGDPEPQGPYCYGVGSDKAFGRDVLECLLRACIYSGINICGSNAEVMPGQVRTMTGFTIERIT
jgi:glutamine synthetase